MSFSPISPAYHQIPNPPAITMTSNGTQKVTVQWNDPLTIPEYVAIVLNSTATGTYEFPAQSVYAEANNGLGDDSELLDQTVYPTPIQNGQVSTGRHIKMISLNSTGYGELTFSSSASATAFSNPNTPSSPAKVWASAQQASAVLDTRAINIVRSGDSMQQYVPDWPYTATYGLTVSRGNVHVSHNWNSTAKQPRYVQPQASNLYSILYELTRGLPIGETPYTGPVTAPLFREIFVGSSSYPYALSDNSHGTFQWSQSDPLPGYLGENPGGTLWGHSDSKPMSASRYMPVAVIKSDRELLDENTGSVGTTQSTEFSVNWIDGIKGKALVRTTYKREREEVDSSNILKFESDDFPFDGVSIAPGQAEFLTSDLWVKRHIDDVTCINEGEESWYRLSATSGAIVLGFQLAGSLTESPLGIIGFNLLAVGIDARAGSYQAGNSYTHTRPSHFGSMKRVIFESGTWQQYSSNPNSFEWLPRVQKDYYAVFKNFDSYNGQGYAGTKFGYVGEWGKSQNSKECAIVRYVDTP